MIIWLASYPKSGNTLLRSILSSYFFSNDGEFKFENLDRIPQFPLINHLQPLRVDINNEKEVFKNFIKAQELINQEKGKIKFFKTHSSNSRVYNSDFTNLENTLAVIYIVRDPRNIVYSLAHHYDYTIDQAIETMLNEKQFMSKTEKNSKIFVGSWSFNYNSWKKFQKHQNFLLVKYEDLVKKKKSTLLKIFKFLQSFGLNFQIDMIKLNKVIKTTEFDKMKAKEQNETFREAMIDRRTGKRKPFFNLGLKNDWRKNLNKKNLELIEISFKKDMIDLGYL